MARGPDEAAEALTTSFRETNQALAGSALAALDLNTRFAQGLFKSRIAVLNNHAANTRQLTHMMVRQSHRQQEAFQTLMRASLDAYLNFFMAASSLLSAQLGVCGEGFLLPRGSSRKCYG